MKNCIGEEGSRTVKLKMQVFFYVLPIKRDKNLIIKKIFVGGSSLARTLRKISVLESPGRGRQTDSSKTNRLTERQRE